MPTLRDQLAFWQRVLRLQDWDLDARLVTDVREFSDPGHCGECRQQKAYRRAVILLMDPAVEAKDDARSVVGQAFPYDIEQVLIHELLHLIVPDAPETEYAVESLSKSLLALHRHRAKESC